MRIRLFKFPATPEAPEQAVLEALQTLIAHGAIAPECLGRIAHGSTVATNALLEGTWGRTALVTTQGFRDVLEIGRQNRPRLYDLHVQRPAAIVPRHLRYEASERVDASGTVVRPLDMDSLQAVAQVLAEGRVEAVAVVFLFSYLSPEHERTARETLERVVDVPVTISSDVLPEFREYERTSTTVVCAALRPVVERYLRALTKGAERLGMAPRWQVMQSSGSVIGAELAEKEPVRILLSGPAAGVQGARMIGESVKMENLITLDMGGTSCDVSLVHQGAISRTSSGSVGGHPVAVRMNDIHTIGAGGGSVAWMDPGGALRVGPKSAGAVPGPACYGRGGEQATVSDAHVVLGHLLPDWPLGGRTAVDVEAARAAVHRLAKGLRLSLEQTALGILQVADASMERAVRLISVERGHDPRTFGLVAFGGAGPLHAASIAARLSIPRVVIPSVAGVLSAAGLLGCKTGREYGQSLVRRIGALGRDEMQSVVKGLLLRGRRELAADGVGENEVRVEISADLRYQGQSHELNIPCPEAGSDLTDATMTAWVDAFHREHRNRYGHASEEEVEVVALRVRMTGPASFQYIDVTTDREEQLRPSCFTHSWFGPDGPVRTCIADRRAVQGGDRVDGPAVLWAPDSTLLIPPGVTATCDALGTMILEIP